MDGKAGLSFEQPDKTFDFLIPNDERLPTFKPKKQHHKRNKTEQNLSDFNILGASGFDAHQKDLGVDLVNAGSFVDQQSPLIRLNSLKNQ